jgi:hypothetical protein
MKALPRTPELLRVARRVVWFEEPERALADPLQFLAHVMVFGTVEDLKALRGIVGKHEYREVLEQVPRGFSTRDLGRTGIWVAAATPRRTCRCAPACSRPGRRLDYPAGKYLGNDNWRARPVIIGTGAIRHGVNELASLVESGGAKSASRFISAMRSGMSRGNTPRRNRNSDPHRRARTEQRAHC